MVETRTQMHADGVGAAAGVTILLVEDETLVRISLAEELRAAGYRVLEAGDGKLARAIFQRDEPIALLVSDVALPGLNGLALARWAMETAPGLRVIMISGSPDNAGESAKVGYFLQKPFSPERLLSLVHGVLADAPRPAGLHAV